jgi:hypothetical protein
MNARSVFIKVSSSSAAEVIPGVTETMDAHDDKQFVAQVTHLVTALGRASALLDPPRQQNTRD